MNNTVAYSSYRMVFTDVKNSAAANSMQIGEIQFFGEKLTGSAVLSPVDTILAIDLDGGSSYPGNEDPSNAVDGTTDKYLNFGKVNSGLIVTPAVGPSTVTSFQITIANDHSERDPTSWALFGTNDTIASVDNSEGGQENWTLIDSGLLALPSAAIRWDQR